MLMHAFPSLIKSSAFDSKNSEVQNLFHLNPSNKHTAPIFKGLEGFYKLFKSKASFPDFIISFLIKYYII